VVWLPIKKSRRSTFLCHQTDWECAVSTGSGRGGYPLRGGAALFTAETSVSIGKSAPRHEKEKDSRRLQAHGQKTGPGTENLSSKCELRYGRNPGGGNALGLERSMPKGNLIDQWLAIGMPLDSCVSSKREG